MSELKLMSGQSMEPDIMSHSKTGTTTERSEEMKKFNQNSYSFQIYNTRHKNILFLIFLRIVF